MKKYVSGSEDETKKIAARLAKNAKDNVFALTGELGAGKTIFAQGFAKGLGIKEKILSPTFVLIKQYQIPNSTKVLFHIDLYRLENFHQLGLEEILSNKNNVVLIEWAERAQKYLPKDVVKIIITKNAADKRIIKVS